MLQRHIPAQGRKPSAEETISLRTRIALWKCVRRDHRFLSRSTKTMEELALRLHVQAARARLRSDHAQELNLPDLTAADEWWKRQWQEEDTSRR